MGRRCVGFLAAAVVLAGCAHDTVIGPITFICDGAPPHELVVTFVNGAHPTMRAQRGGRIVTMPRAPAASGAKYESAAAMFWEHQGEARLVWDRDAPEMTCKARR
jgi:membrane-bound inhibitor of C-type lysozyme